VGELQSRRCRPDQGLAESLFVAKFRFRDYHNGILCSSTAEKERPHCLRTLFHRVDALWPVHRCGIRSGCVPLGVPIKNNELPINDAVASDERNYR